MHPGIDVEFNQTQRYYDPDEKIYETGRCVHADRNDERRRHNGGAYYGGIPWNKNGDGECADGAVDTGCSQHRDGITVVGNRRRLSLSCGGNSRGRSD